MAGRDLVDIGYDEDRFEEKVNNKNLLCSICRNVLKNPVQCPNEHCFCRSCIRQHLEEISKICPLCRCRLTEETLTKPSRFLLESLLCLKIRCDHVERGCQEFIELEFLDRHVEVCGYSPTLCANHGCLQEINRGDRVRHENELCRFRKIVCDECGQEVIWASSRVHACFMRKEVDELAKRFHSFQKDMSEVLKDEVKQMNQTQEELITEVRNRTDLFTGRQKIFVLGGRHGTNRHDSVESYSWPKNAWTLEPAMTELRSGGSAFVHGREIFVAGGYTGTENMDSIESWNVDEEHAEWIKQPVKLPFKCDGQQMIYQENSVILTGGRDGDNVSAGIYEIQLNTSQPPKLMTHMPEPRCYHGCEIIDNQIVIAGGQITEYIKDARNTVYLYDINNNEWKPMTPLPFAFSEMATVSYKGNVILIGGVKNINYKSETLNSVIMYSLKTGRVTTLPSLHHKRAASAAVITGNMIFVMGGYEYETETYHDSVECLDLNTNVCRELSPMTTKRLNPSAVVLPFG